MGKFNGFDWVHVYPDQIDVFTVKVDLEDIVVELEGVMSSACRKVSIFGRPTGTRLVVNQGAPEKLTYAQFQLDHFAANQLPAGSKAEEDYDGDGIANYAEFVFNMDPTSNSAAPSSCFRA